jgi:hypothetical protein
MIVTESSVLAEQDLNKVLTLYRTCTNTLIDQHGERDRFAPTTVGNFLIASFSQAEFDFVLDAVLPVIEQHVGPVTPVHQRVLCYKRNSGIPRHFDQGKDSNLSVIIPMPSDYTGGEMIVGGTMPMLLPGDMLCYDYSVPHEVKRVKSGIRYAINLRVRCESFRNLAGNNHAPNPAAQ